MDHSTCVAFQVGYIDFSTLTRRNQTKVKKSSSSRGGGSGRHSSRGDDFNAELPNKATTTITTTTRQIHFPVNLSVGKDSVTIECFYLGSLECDLLDERTLLLRGRGLAHTAALGGTDHDESNSSSNTLPREATTELLSELRQDFERTIELPPDISVDHHHPKQISAGPSGATLIRFTRKQLVLDQILMASCTQEM